MPVPSLLSVDFKKWARELCDVFLGQQSLYFDSFICWVTHSRSLSAAGPFGAPRRRIGSHRSEHGYTYTNTQWRFTHKQASAHKSYSKHVDLIIWTTNSLQFNSFCPGVRFLAFASPDPLFLWLRTCEVNVRSLWSSHQLAQCSRWNHDQQSNMIWCISKWQGTKPLSQLWRLEKEKTQLWQWQQPRNTIFWQKTLMSPVARIKAGVTGLTQM